VELAEEGYCGSAGGEEVEAPPAYCKWDAAVLVARACTPGMQRVGTTETGGDSWGMITTSTRGDVAMDKNKAWTHICLVRCQSGALVVQDAVSVNKETWLVQ
jgi:hypothetical protein